MMQKILFLSLIYFILVGASNAQSTNTNSKASVNNPKDFRDPFKRRRFKRRRIRSADSFNRSNFSNQASIDGVPLDQIQITGVLLGEKRRALARIVGADGRAGSKTFILREGMTLGENKAEIKAILPGGIALAEKIRNVYDEDEFLETIIPVSN